MIEDLVDKTPFKDQAECLRSLLRGLSINDIRLIPVMFPGKPCGIDPVTLVAELRLAYQRERSPEPELTPAARKLLDSLPSSVDLSSIVPSGASGRITVADIRNVVSEEE